MGNKKKLLSNALFLALAGCNTSGRDTMIGQSGDKEPVLGNVYTSPCHRVYASFCYGIAADTCSRDRTFKDCACHGTAKACFMDALEKVIELSYGLNVIFYAHANVVKSFMDNVCEMLSKFDTICEALVLGAHTSDPVVKGVIRSIENCHTYNKGIKKGWGNNVRCVLKIKIKELDKVTNLICTAGCTSCCASSRYALEVMAIISRMRIAFSEMKHCVNGIVGVMHDISRWNHNAIKASRCSNVDTIEQAVSKIPNACKRLNGLSKNLTKIIRRMRKSLAEARAMFR